MVVYRLFIDNKHSFVTKVLKEHFFKRHKNISLFNFPKIQISCLFWLLDLYNHLFKIELKNMFS